MHERQFREPEAAEIRQAFLALLHLLHFLHHLLHFAELLQELVDVLHARAGAHRDALAAAAVVDVYVGALFRRHRLDDRLNLAHLLAVEVDVLSGELLLEACGPVGSARAGRACRHAR